MANNKVDAIDRQRDGEGKGIALEYEKSYEMRKKGGGGGGGVNKKKRKKKLYCLRVDHGGPHVASAWIITRGFPLCDAVPIDRRSADWIRIGGKVYLSVDTRYFRELFPPPCLERTARGKGNGAGTWWIYFIMELSVGRDENPVTKPTLALGVGFGWIGLG